MKVLFAVLLLLPMLAMANMNTAAIEKIEGSWKVTRYFNAASIGASDQVLQSKIGETLTINAKGDGFEDLTPADCPYQGVTIIQGDLKLYFENTYQADSSVLPLTSPMTVINTDCESFFYDKNVNKHIIFESNGDFFEAVRTSQ